MKKFEIRLFLTFFILFSYFSQWNDVWDFNSAFDLTKAIVEEKRIEIDSYYNNTELKFYYKGHYYTPLSPFLSFLVTWIYLVIKPFTTLFTHEFLMVVLSNSLWGALSVLLIYKLVSKFVQDEKIRLLTTLSYGLGTSIFPYSLGFYVYDLSILLLLTAFYLLYTEKQTNVKNPKNFFLSGILSGISYITYPISIFIFLLLFLYGLIVDKKYALFFILGSLIGILPGLIYSFIVFDRMEIFSLERYVYLKAKEISWQPSKFGPYIPLRVAHKIICLSNPLKILPRVLFYPWNGLFFYYPVLFLAFIGIGIMCWNRKLEGVFILFSFLFLWIYASTFRWWGDYSFGPRRLLLLTPFLTLGLPALMEKAGYKIVLPFLVWSFFVNLLSLQPWISFDALPNINETYQTKIENFEIIRNPIFEDFLPNFLKNGPRCPLFENLILYRTICIRMDKDANYPLLILNQRFENRVKPFLCAIPLGILLVLLWSKEIFSRMKCRGWDLNPRRD